jgi:hypothetical protein
MGALIRAKEWRRTPLGSIESWPQSLRSAVSILLPSKAQIALFWGPELVAIYNDAYLAEAFCRNFESVLGNYLGGESLGETVELIFVNDGSVDDSWTTLREVASQFNFVKIIDLSRNFGQHTAILCGYHNSSANPRRRLPPRSIFRSRFRPSRNARRLSLSRS